jgi:hypothetical protein
MKLGEATDARALLYMLAERLKDARFELRQTKTYHDTYDAVHGAWLEANNSYCSAKHLLKEMERK